MGADTREHIGAHIGAHIGEHSYESKHMEVYRKNAGPRFRGTRFVRACAVETHMDISQELLCVEIYSINAGPASDHLD